MICSMLFLYFVQEACFSEQLGKFFYDNENKIKGSFVYNLQIIQLTKKVKCIRNGYDYFCSSSLIINSLRKGVAGGGGIQKKS